MRAVRVLAWILGTMESSALGIVVIGWCRWEGSYGCFHGKSNAVLGEYL